MQIVLDIAIQPFVTSLEKPTIAKVLRTLDLLERFGNKLGMPHSKALKEGLFELRVRGSQEVRIIYVFYRRRAVLLHGFIKKSQTTPVKHLKIALKKKRAMLDKI